MRIGRFWKTGLVVILLLGLMGAAFAEGNKKSERYSAMKEISGELTAITKDSIAIMYYFDKDKSKEYEISLPIAKDVKLGHLKSLSELAVGDIVNVQYAEIIEENKEGKSINRFAKVISFARRPAQKPETSALSSEHPFEPEPGPETEGTVE